LLLSAQSWEAAGSIGLAAGDSLSQPPTGVSLHSCGSQAIPSRRGVRRSCRNCGLGSVQKLWPFACLGNSQEGGRGRGPWPDKCYKQARAAGFHSPSTWSSHSGGLRQCCR